MNFEIIEKIVLILLEVLILTMFAFIFPVVIVKVSYYFGENPREILWIYRKIILMGSIISLIIMIPQIFSLFSILFSKITKNKIENNNNEAKVNLKKLR